MRAHGGHLVDVSIEKIHTDFQKIPAFRSIKFYKEKKEDENIEIERKKKDFLE